MIAAIVHAEGKPVIGPSGTVRVMVATKQVGFRQGMKGLAMLVREHKKADVPIRQATRGRCLPLAEDRGWRDAFVGGGIVGAARGARLAGVSTPTRGGRRDRSRIIVGRAAAK
ncbi:hypothetical protein [Bradyrhizobium shewense]|uniref:hypothetical protein n=1 Tax=Bradyrhizobium shewense TaxID=1761772 RepID=UPI003D3213F9